MRFAIAAAVAATAASSAHAFATTPRRPRQGGRPRVVAPRRAEDDNAVTTLDAPASTREAAATGDDAAAATVDAVADDVPPLPERGFEGMDVTGTINGVTLTSSEETSKETRRRRKARAAAEADAADDAAAASLDALDADGAAAPSLADRLSSTGAVSAAAVATAAVNAAVSMKSLSAPSTDKSYVSLDTSSDAIDDEGLPLVYDKDLIETYWKKERGALNQRWSYFVGKAVPFLTKLVTLFIAEGEIEARHVPGLSRRARLDLQDLGPTFIKLGQMMSVRPDVLPQATLDELTALQDSVEPFDTSVAVRQIEEELGGPLGQFFTSISEEPVAAASLAQASAPRGRPLRAPPAPRTARRPHASLRRAPRRCTSPR